MKTSEIWDLVEFLNKRGFCKHWKDITFLSKSCPNFEIVAECIEDDDHETDYGRVWKIGINPIPYDSEEISDWVDEEELTGKCRGDYKSATYGRIVSTYDDWVMETIDVEQLNEWLEQDRRNTDKWINLVNRSKKEEINDNN